MHDHSTFDIIQLWRGMINPFFLMYLNTRKEEVRGGASWMGYWRDKVGIYIEASLFCNKLMVKEEYGMRMDVCCGHADEKMV